MILLMSSRSNFGSNSRQKGNLRDVEIEKDELSKALERHNNYIEELLENVKEKDLILTSLEQDKIELEDEINQARCEIEKVAYFCS